LTPRKKRSDKTQIILTQKKEGAGRKRAFQQSETNFARVKKGP